MGSSRPSLKYNAINQRWEIVGKSGDLKMAIADSNRGDILNMIGFVGSSAAISSMGLGKMLVATITNASDLKVGDKVFGNPKPAISADSLSFVSHFHVPSKACLMPM